MTGDGTMATATIRAAARDGAGKGAARKLRATGRVPAVLYGHGDRPRSLSLDAHELGLLMASVSTGTTIVTIELEGEGSQDVLIREVQKHAYRPEVLHVDLFHVNAGETLTLKVPVRLNGSPYGVHTEGGVLDHVLYELEVQTLPKNIPDVIEVDVSELKVGDSVRVSDVAAGDYQIMNDPDLPIASVMAPRLATDDEIAADEAPQPELVGGSEEQEDA
jgi:large subunit ribosomal protein L25